MKKLSLNKKPAIVFTIFIASSCTIATLGLYNLNLMNSVIDSITSVNVPRIQNAYKVQGEFRQLAIRQSLLMMEDNKENQIKNQKQLLESHADIVKLFDEAKKDSSTEKLAMWISIEDQFNKWWDKSLLIQKAAIENNDVLAKTINSESREIRRNADKDLLVIIQGNEDVLKNQTAIMAETYHQAKIMMISISVLATCIAIAIGFIVLKAASKAIQEVITSLREGSIQVSSAAHQIASSSEELSQSATEQASSLEETAASIEEMNSMVAKNSENASSTAQMSGNSKEAADEGRVVVEKMISSMNLINESNNKIMSEVNVSNESMMNFVKVIEEIGNKTKVINDIVFQTKLLSFNASVEAARAGEHGKGFAVVAEEVGKLAEMSGSAALEISTLLSDSIKQANVVAAGTKSSIENLIEEGKTKVNEGVAIARQCGDVLEKIVHNVSSVSGMASEIAQASHEQSQGVAEITKAMGQLDQMTQLNSSTSEECAAAAEELSAQSESLKNAVTQLMVVINGLHSIEEESTPRSKISSKRINKLAVPKIRGREKISQTIHIQTLTTLDKLIIFNG